MRRNLQFFPFGRGDRGSRQRLCLEFAAWGGVGRMHEMRVNVLRTHAPKLTVLLVGVSTLCGGFRLVFRSEFRKAWQTAMQAVKDHKQVRKANKIWQAKRKGLTTNGKSV